MIAFLLLSITLLLAPSGLAYPADENIIGENGAWSEGGSAAAKGCFHFYVSRNMSSLLSDATKMLASVRDRRERDWILTFIFRIKALAEHLRAHPRSRNDDCIGPTDPALYFVDDLKRAPPVQQGQPEESLGTVQSGRQFTIQSKKDTTSLRKEAQPESAQQTSDSQSTASSERSQSVGQPATSSDSQERSATPQEGTQSMGLSNAAKSSQGVVHQGGPLTDEPGGITDEPKGTVQSGSGQEAMATDHVIVISSSPDCEENDACAEALRRQQAARGHTDDLLVQELHSKQQEKNREEDRMQQKVLKERIRKALLQEMVQEVKKLKTVGGTEEDLVNLWKQSESDAVKPSENFYEFDYEETGTAAGDPNDYSSTPNEQTVAPSLGDIKRQSNKGKGTKVYEPYDDSDVLVKQLFDVRYEHSKTTKSVDDQKEEYLITSTHVPY